ncbi:MAG: OB-fold domain-containing protein [Ilumatobacteraceae bacterium]
MANIPTFDSPVTRPYWEGIEEGELRLPRCERCGSWQWYPVGGTGHSCGGDLRWTAVEPTGRIFSFTTVRRPFLPGATTSDPPLTTVLFELDGAPDVRLIGQLVEGAEPVIGARVTGRFVEADGRRDLRFEPVPWEGQDTDDLAR